MAPRIAAEDRALAGIVIMAGSTRRLADVAREQIAYLASLTPDVPSTAESRETALQTLLRAAPDSYWKDLGVYNPAQTAATLTIKPDGPAAKTYYASARVTPATAPQPAQSAQPPVQR